MLLHGDSLEVLKDINNESIDLIVTDPPYGIEFMGKDWDKALPSIDIWKECYRVLKTGKLVFVMCSPRQDVLSRMIISLEDAGFRTNYTSIYWTYASGFPKAANVSKLIDKKAGAEREIIGVNETVRNKNSGDLKRGVSHMMVTNRNLSPEFYKTNAAAGFNHIETVGLITKPATEEAKKMEGAYVGFQPKPAVEIVLVVSKGKTITWLDDCRIPYSSDSDLQTTSNKVNKDVDKWEIKEHGKIYGGGNGLQCPEIGQFGNEKGRFPANLLVSDDVLNDGKITKATGGIFKTSWSSQNSDEGWQRKSHKDYTNIRDSNNGGYGDTGSYSRYFSLEKWYEKTFPFLVVAKASKSEKGEFNRHATVKPVKLMSYLITMGSRENDLILDPFCGSGTTLIAADNLARKYVGIEINKDYLEIAKYRLLPHIQQTKLLISKF